jgi:ribosome maturation factor RimP
MQRPKGSPSPVVDDDLRVEIEAIAESAGCELVHAEFKGGVLRLFIDRPDGGVGLGDCETVSKQVSALLDVVDFGSRRYVLEVSSPGLDRQLYRAQDYQRFTGRLVRVTWFAPEGGKRTVVGRLDELRPPPEGRTESEITVVDSQSGERYDIPLGNVSVARLEIEL